MVKQTCLIKSLSSNVIYDCLVVYVNLIISTKLTEASVDSLTKKTIVCNR